MYSAERRQEILSLIEKRSHVSVDHLASHFGVSRSSIRRDLSQLHDDGLLTRTYGGAIALHSNHQETPFAERRVANFTEKDRIGRAAAGYVTTGDTIFIDGGTTTECMLPYLADKRVTVVTYGLNIINRLSTHPHITLIGIGGAFHHDSHTFTGVLALANMQLYNIRFDKTFMAASGVAATAGITNASLEEIPIKRKAIEGGQQNLLLADSSKIGVIRAGLIAPLTEVDRLITGSQADRTELAQISEVGLTIELV